MDGRAKTEELRITLRRTTDRAAGSTQRVGVRFDQRCTLDRRRAAGFPSFGSSRIWALAIVERSRPRGFGRVGHAVDGTSRAPCFTPPFWVADVVGRRAASRVVRASGLSRAFRPVIARSSGRPTSKWSRRVSRSVRSCRRDARLISRVGQFKAEPSSK